MSAIALGHFTMFHHVNNWQGADTDEPSWNSADLGGGAAVMGFFCVSGFIMTIAYGDRDFTSAEWGAINRRNFYAKRFARLAPLYYFSLVVSRNYILEWPEASPYNFLTLFCVQTWTGSPGLWNGVLWSVSTIAYFYYRFPWIISRVKRLVAKYDVQRVVIALGLINILKYSLFFLLPWDLKWLVYWYARAFPPFAMSTMLIGMVVGVRRASATNLRPPTAFVGDKDGTVPVPPSEEELRERRKWVRRADGLGAGLTLVAVAIAFVTYENTDREPRDLQIYTRVIFEALIPPFVSFFLEAVTMAGEWCVAGKVLNFAFFQLLGEWSYAIYVLQLPVCE